MLINLTSLSPEFPVEVEEAEYNRLIQLKGRGWSHSDTEIEWLAKLHYLRRGMKEGRVAKEQFADKEKELILNWWKRFC